MNNSSSWNCFSWNRRKSSKDGDSVSPRKHQEGVGSEVPDEQFANLLGGEWNETEQAYTLVSDNEGFKRSCRVSVIYKNK